MKIRYLLLSLLFPCIVSAQDTDSILSAIKNRIESRLKEINPTDCQLFTDKSIYTPNEIVWLSAFDGTEAPDSAMFFVFLTDRFQKRPVWSGRFLMVSGAASGYFMIPDSLKDGNYALVGYSDRNDRGDKNDEVRPTSVIFKNIYIRSMRQAAFDIMPFDEDLSITADSIKLKYLVTGLTDGIVKDAEVFFYIYADSTLISSGRTSTNSMGEVHISSNNRADLKARALELVLNIQKNNLSRTAIFSLPQARENDMISPYILASEQKERHEIEISVGNLRPKLPYYMVIYDKEKVLYRSVFSVNHPEGQIRLPTDSFPSGNLHIELFDEKTNSIAEEALLLQAPKWKVILEPDSSSYQSRSVVRMTVKCRDMLDRPVQGRLALTCVYNKRVIDKAEDINNYMGDMINEKLKVRRFGGLALPNNKRLKRDVDILVTGGKHWDVVRTDSSGHFIIDPKLMVGTNESNIVVAVTGTSPDEYSLRLIEPDKDINTALAAYHYPAIDPGSSSKTTETFSEQELKQWKNMLKPVVVRSAGRDEDLEITARLTSGPGPIWVCACGHWKCTGCPPMSEPVVGQSYFDKVTRKNFIYRGRPNEPSVPYITKIDPLIVYSPFPIIDYRSSSDTELYSTLYWNPAVDLNEKGEAKIQFYTNDLRGTFAILAEGKAANGSIYGDAEISVK